MSLYADISVVYDDLFPVSSTLRSLLEALRDEGVRSVVDCGCGTGSQLLPFAEAGLSCVGFDADPSLVAVARRKLACCPRTRIEVGRFEELPRFASPPADLLLCLGNSLVHVPQEDAARFLKDAFGALSSGGTMLLQLLNYERMLREGVTELPMIRTEDGTAEFRRKYVWENRRVVRFGTVLRLAAGDQPRILRNEISLYPLYPEELWEMAAAAGFSQVRFFADFARSEFSAGSEALVCVARRP